MYMFGSNRESSVISENGHYSLDFASHGFPPPNTIDPIFKIIAISFFYSSFSCPRVRYCAVGNQSLNIT